MAELTGSDKQSVDKVRGMLERYPESKQMLAKYDLENVTRVPAQDALPNGTQVPAQLRLPPGIRIPSKEAGGAPILLIPLSDIRAIGETQQVSRMAAYNNRLLNAIVLPEPTNEDTEEQRETYVRQFNATGAAAETYPYKPLKPYSPELGELRWVASALHEECHSGDPVFFLSSKNSDVKCMGEETRFLAKHQNAVERDSKWILNYWALSAVNLWPSELPISTDGKLNTATRDLLPGGESFTQTVNSMISRLDYEETVVKDAPSISSNKSRRELCKSLINSPLNNSPMKAFRDVVEVQLGREFDDNGTQSKESKEDYVSRRLVELEKYLSGETEKFELKRFYPTRLASLRGDK